MNRDLWMVFIIMILAGTALTAQAVPGGPPGPPASMTIEASPAAAAADGTAYSTIIATLKDAYGQPSPGANTYFNTNLGTITTQYGYYEGFGYLNISDAQGKAYAIIKSNTVGSAVITATTGNGISKQVTVTFTTPLPKYNISGYKINDFNGNGVWNAGEAGIPGWNITLKNATTGAVIASTLTDSQGMYQFNDVVQGNYNVTEQDRAGWIHTSASFRVINLNSNVINQNFTNQYDPIPPAVTNPLAAPAEILLEEDNNADYAHMSTTLSVTATDNVEVTGVTVDLSSIGFALTPMTNSGGNVWSVVTNATGTPGAKSLVVNATDGNGNSNTSESIGLTVLRNGDVDDNGLIDFRDVDYLAGYLLGVPGYEVINMLVADVDGNGVVDFGDVDYLASNLLGVPGYEKLK